MSLETGGDPQETIQKMVTENQVVLFMKGTPDMPQCGFSMTAVAVVRALGVDFAAFDVLSDMSVRQGIKEYSQWPTIPQLYINGKFVGGSDIIKEMWEQGQLEELVAAK